MSSWGIADAASSAPLWACTSVKLAPTAGNRTTLFQNETLSTFITGVTIGLFNIGNAEQSAQQVTSTDGSTILSTAGAGHAGWNLRTVGSGGRANRVQVETLVTLTSVA
jgi:hypothetical protein